jgi:DNA-binding transcriptional MerR regulator
MARRLYRGGLDLDTVSVSKIAGMLISEFARLGQVSVRMLRHYDAIGLLSPSRLESGGGYRSYSPDQLQTLNRIVALKDLGFTLDQVGRLLHDDLDVGELRGMLRLKRAQLENEARAVETRLAAVETRLRMIEKENTMSPDYVVKTVPSMRLVARTATVDADRLGEHIEPMFEAVAAGLRNICGTLSMPIATYAETETGGGGPANRGRLRQLDHLGAFRRAARIGVADDDIYGPMTRIQESWQDLHRWVIDNGYNFAGPSREFYVRAESDDQADWVTELQQPVEHGQGAVPANEGAP